MLYILLYFNICFIFFYIFLYSFIYLCLMIVFCPIGIYLILFLEKKLEKRMKKSIRNLCMWLQIPVHYSSDSFRIIRIIKILLLYSPAYSFFIFLFLRLYDPFCFLLIDSRLVLGSCFFIKKI